MKPIVYRLLLLTVTLALAWTSITFRLGGVVPEDFVNSEIPVNQLTFETQQVYSPTEWRRLALKLQEEGQLQQAETALYHSLSTDPTNALSVAVLAQLYAGQGKQQQAQYLFEHGRHLWPAKFYQLQSEHAKQQAEIQLDMKLKELKTKVKDKKELAARTRHLKNTHKQQLSDYLQKLEQDTRDAYP